MATGCRNTAVYYQYILKKNSISMVFDVNNRLCQQFVSQLSLNLVVFGVLWNSILEFSLFFGVLWKCNLGRCSNISFNG